MPVHYLSHLSIPHPHSLHIDACTLPQPSLDSTPSQSTHRCLYTTSALSRSHTPTQMKCQLNYYRQSALCLQQLQQLVLPAPILYIIHISPVKLCSSLPLHGTVLCIKRCSGHVETGLKCHRKY